MFITPKRNARSFNYHAHSSSPSWATTGLLSVFTNLPTVSISYKWNHVTRMQSFATGFLHLAECAQGSSMCVADIIPPFTCTAVTRCLQPKLFRPRDAHGHRQMWAGTWHGTGNGKDFQAFKVHTYFAFVKLPQSFQQLTTDFQRGLLFCSLLENHSRCTSFPNREE